MLFLIECIVRKRPARARLVEFGRHTGLKIRWLFAVPVQVRQRVFPGRLAQLVEQLTFNQLVIGSNPIAPTTFVMTYVVTEKCIKCKYTDCVEVCPVDCFVETDLMLVIDPNLCIDCGVCVQECPIEAIVSDLDPLANDWILHNKTQSLSQNYLLHKKTPPHDADLFANTPNKKAFLSENQ